MCFSMRTAELASITYLDSEIRLICPDVYLFKTRYRGDNPVFENKHRLDDSSQPASSFEMTYIRFDTSTDP